jgi:protein-tyrosine-phosphatase
VLFLCTHNSARSQIAEALLRHLGGARVEVFSAGTEVSRVHPLALETLQKHEIDTTGLYSKSLDKFLGQDFDYVITVCDNARESCPVFPGDPERIHWSFPDPSAVTDPDQQYMAFQEVFAGLEKRLKLLLTIIDRDMSN